MTSDTPARDALTDMMARQSALAGRDLIAQEAVDWMLYERSLAFAALVEQAPLTDDELRALGGELTVDPLCITFDNDGIHVGGRSCDCAPAARFPRPEEATDEAE